MKSSRELNFDTLVVGGGIGGLEAALNLADQNFKVAIVEKDATVGGKMIRLSKVFPTLDCASCITTPKMAAAAHHENITIFTYCDLKSIHRKSEDVVIAAVTQKPRYVDADKCIGCRQCEYACPVYVPDEEQSNFALRKAIYIPFSTAIPQLALLDVDNCSLCGKCAKVCPTDAVDYFQQSEEFVIHAKTVILASGFKLTPIDQKPEYGEGKVENLITSMDMERLLAPNGPYQRVLRPSDGKEPDSIAYVQCAGSRDKTLGVPYCSRVCCMYAIKQAMLLSGSLPLADITIYYMDIRAFGKGYEQFYQNAKAMGIEFVKGKVARITEDEEQNPIVRVELIDEFSRVVERKHDLVVLSVGMLPGYNPEAIYAVPTAEDGFVQIPDYNVSPTETVQEGIFATGTATGPMDIVDSIMTAGAAAAEASAYIRAHNGHRAKPEAAPEKRSMVYA